MQTTPAMTVKEYLGLAYRIDRRINNKLEQILSLRELACKMTTTFSETPCKPGRNPNGKEGVVVKLMELEEEINRDIDMLVDLKRDIITVIRRVENPEYQTVLELRYLNFKNWGQIAEAMNHSLRNVYKIHELALKSIEHP